MTLSMESDLPVPPPFPMPVPFGWFFVSHSADLRTGVVKPVHYFGLDLVLFRGEGGEVGLLDAYCPHLGAHLGHGGRVDGSSVRCPFHAWAFDRDGVCTDIPYARRIPPKINGKRCIRRLPVVERNGVVWAWYHPHDKEPDFDVIENPEVTDASWHELARYRWRFRGAVQEFNENGIDLAHFPVVHGIDAPYAGEILHDRHVRITRYGITELDESKPDTNMRAEVIQNGAGQQFTRIIRGEVENLNLTFVTPIDRQQIELNFVFYGLSRFAENSPEHQSGMLLAAGTAGSTGVEGDMVVWTKKIHRARPLLCDADGPIMRYREYFAQFYAESAGEDRGGQGTIVRGQ